MIPKTPTLYPSPACGGGKGGGFFGNRSCSNKKLERDDDSKKLHPAVAVGQRTEDRGQRTKDRGQRTEDRGQRTEDRGQRTEDREALVLRRPSSAVCLGTGEESPCKRFSSPARQAALAHACADCSRAFIRTFD